jgi:hypothetical protein
MLERVWLSTRYIVTGTVARSIVTRPSWDVTGVPFQKDY